MGNTKRIRPYEPHAWECGETITADAMNNLETGVQEALASGGGGYTSNC